MMCVSADHESVETEKGLKVQDNLERLLMSSSSYLSIHQRCIQHVQHISYMRRCILRDTSVD